MHTIEREVIRRVAVVDDDDESRTTLADELVVAGFEAVRPRRTHYANVGVLVDEIRSNADAAICDHRLQEGNLGQFYGAQVVAELYEAHVPAVLMTEWGRADSYGPIRQFRRRIPALLRTSESSSEAIKEALTECARELRGEVPANRTPRRTMVVIHGLVEIARESIVEAFIPAWESHEPMRFPLNLIPPDLRPHVKHDAMFAAWVNIDADREEDLFLERFELAPDPDGDFGNG
jgi:hypothetical protein